MADAATSGPLLLGPLVYGFGDSGDAAIHGFAQADGISTFGYSPTATKAVGPATFGNETVPVMYFTDSGGKLSAAIRNGTGGSPAPGWATGFVGTSITKNNTNVSFSGTNTIGTEPTLATDGTLYFGADNGSVYAIITDSTTGTVAPSAANWPRIGFDNCNSGNSAYTNCP